ncbi:OLC1v1009035C1 [Oldenlandia corymbosa var. corymbosa]|uniref:OLC1v1009035C1 n=1 Tax=Oldenlandia corymbosa var. corymbosa TaxID=529605 RepID=A0AAV1DR60_OLDCO|nr:OLC1v1009035C1 [Oldenlandia corymbosa var. corymbosa]
MALVRPVFCELKNQSPVVQKNDLGLNLQSQKVRLPEVLSSQNGSSESSSNKIVLQPRLCTLRTYGSTDRIGLMKTAGIDGDDDQVSRFFATLSDYIESSKKSQDFEIISGRLAMVVFAATVSMESVTGNSLFRKMDLQGIEETAGACLGAIVCAAVFAWFSSNRKRVGRIFTVSCNVFIDNLIDQIVDGLFYEDTDDWSDDI